MTKKEHKPKTILLSLTWSNYIALSKLLKNSYYNSLSDIINEVLEIYRSN